MESRRTFLKVLAGIAAFIIPWTLLPQRLGRGLEVLLGRPPVELEKQQGLEGLSLPSTEVLGRKALADIQALSDPYMQGRRAGTRGETKALVYLEQQLRMLHLKPYGDNKYWQMFSIPPMEERIINGRALFRPSESDGFRVPAANILAGLPGENQEEHIILSAHYDHLGIYKGSLCPGANDNASGVGCVLQVVRRLVQEANRGSRPRRNILIALWGAEEMGYLGSKHFVKNPTIPLSQVKTIINMDTVANGDNMDYILWSNGVTELVEMIRDVGNQNKANIEYIAKQGHQSDEAAFAGTGIPAVTLLSKEWLVKNHTAEDDISLINEEKLETACTLLYNIVRKLAF